MAEIMKASDVHLTRRLLARDALNRGSIASMSPGSMVISASGGEVNGVLWRFDGTGPPTVADDEDDGYEIGSAWVDATNKNVYWCVDASIGAAIWVLGNSNRQVARFRPAEGLLYAANKPSLGHRGGHPILAYDDTTKEYATFIGIVPFTYQKGDITVSVYWAGVATTGDVQWRVAWERLAAGAGDIDVGAFGSTKAGLDTTHGTAGVLTVTTVDFTNAEAQGIEPGDYYRMQLFREADHLNDDMVGDAQVVFVAVDENI